MNINFILRGVPDEAVLKKLIHRLNTTYRFTPSVVSVVNQRATNILVIKMSEGASQEARETITTYVSGFMDGANL